MNPTKPPDSNHRSCRGLFFFNALRAGPETGQWLADAGTRYVQHERFRHAGHAGHGQRGNRACHASMEVITWDMGPQ